MVIGSLDPNPLVSGVSILEEHGVEVEVMIIPEIVTLNDTFIINQILKRPKYILKSAITLNRKIADSKGSSKWISNEKSREHVHEQLRSTADAILTTAKTVIQDNATMNIRIKHQIEEELNLIVFDLNLELLEKENQHLSCFYKRNKSAIYLVTDKAGIKPVLPNVEVIHIPMQDGLFDITVLHKELLSRNICQVLIEAGGSMNATMMDAKSVDEIHTFVCPRILMDNAAINQFNSSQIQTMDNALKLQLLDSMTIGEDILLRHKVIH